jgi:hypothetical protein
MPTVGFQIAEDRRELSIPYALHGITSLISSLSDSIRSSCSARSHNRRSGMPIYDRNRKSRVHSRAVSEAHRRHPEPARMKEENSISPDRYRRLGRNATRRFGLEVPRIPVRYQGIRQMIGVRRNAGLRQIGRPQRTCRRLWPKKSEHASGAPHPSQKPRDTAVPEIPSHR